MKYVQNEDYRVYYIRILDSILECYFKFESAPEEILHTIQWSEASAILNGTTNDKSMGWKNSNR